MTLDTIETVAAAICAVVTAASAICALSPTPAPDTILGKVYRVVEFLGLVIGKAKQSGLVPANPVVDKLGADVVAVAKNVLGKAAIVGLVAGGLALSACSAPQIAAAVTPAVLPADQLRQVCQVAQPMLDVAADPSLPASVTETAIPAQAYCSQLLAGVVPPTTDGNTPRWLPEVVEGVQVAASVAKVVLPIVLPLL